MNSVEEIIKLVDEQDILTVLKDEEQEEILKLPRFASRAIGCDLNKPTHIRLFNKQNLLHSFLETFFQEGSGNNFIGKHILYHSSAFSYHNPVQNLDGLINSLNKVKKFTENNMLYHEYEKNQYQRIDNVVTLIIDSLKIYRQNQGSNNYQYPDFYSHVKKVLDEYNIQEGAFLPSMNSEFFRYTLRERLDSYYTNIIGKVSRESDNKFISNMDKETEEKILHTLPAKNKQYLAKWLYCSRKAQEQLEQPVTSRLSDVSHNMDSYNNSELSSGQSRRSFAVVVDSLRKMPPLIPISDWLSKHEPCNREKQGAQQTSECHKLKTLPLEDNKQRTSTSTTHLVENYQEKNTAKKASSLAKGKRMSPEVKENLQECSLPLKKRKIRDQESSSTGNQIQEIIDDLKSYIKSPPPEEKETNPAETSSRTKRRHK